MTDNNDNDSVNSSVYGSLDMDVMFENCMATIELVEEMCKKNGELVKELCVENGGRDLVKEVQLLRFGVQYFVNYCDKLHNENQGIKPHNDEILIAQNADLRDNFLSSKVLNKSLKTDITELNSKFEDISLKQEQCSEAIKRMLQLIN